MHAGCPPGYGERVRRVALLLALSGCGRIGFDSAPSADGAADGIAPRTSTALEAAGGNQTEAAKQLGISRRTLIYRMEKHGLKPHPESRK